MWGCDDVMMGGWGDSLNCDTGQRYCSYLTDFSKLTFRSEKQSLPEKSK